jgi:hypothetical protein
MPSLASKADSAEQAISRAQALSTEHVGVVAFARSERGNSVLEEFGKVLHDQLRASLGHFAAGSPGGELDAPASLLAISRDTHSPLEGYRLLRNRPAPDLASPVTSFRAGRAGL